LLAARAGADGRHHWSVGRLGRDNEIQGEECMRARVVIIVSVAAVAAFIAMLAQTPNSIAQQPSAMGDPNPDPAPSNPQMSALMSMLIQPRHAKLGLA